MRRWTCIELISEYCEAALGRFIRDPQETAKPVSKPKDPSNYYRVPRPGILWNGKKDGLLPKDGGRKRQVLSRGGASHGGNNNSTSASPKQPETKTV